MSDEFITLPADAVMVVSPHDEQPNSAEWLEIDPSMFRIVDGRVAVAPEVIAACR